MNSTRQLTRREALSLAAGLPGLKRLVRLWHRSTSKGKPSDFFASVDGLLEAVLEAREGWVGLASGQAYLWAYNGVVPGPLLEARPGDSVRLTLVNSLAEATNLHFHGLHVPPTGSGDNPFLEIPPGDAFTYEFTIPPDHPGGTFWYHPHVHGRVAEQLFHGLAGLFVIRGELDALPEIAAATERFVVLKDFELDSVGRVPPYNSFDRMLGREGSLVTVNGELQPTLEVRHGEVLRLRILNASNARFYRLKLEEHPLHVVGTGSGPLADRQEMDEILLAPGERAEILVRGERDEGAYRLLDLPYNRATMGMGMMRRQERTPRNLATILYQGQADGIAPLPDRLVPVEPLAPPLQARRIFQLGQGMMMGGVFRINGRSFDAARVDTRVNLGSVEDWEIRSDSMDHPFHLHVHPFQVVGPDGETERAWRDTVLVKAGRRIALRVRFANYPGRTVYHCHIAEHEDLGMMGVLDALS